MVSVFGKKHTYKINICTLHNKNLTISFAYTFGLYQQLKVFLNLILES